MAALVRVAADLRAVLAAHVPLQFVDGGHLRPADDVQGHCLMRIAAEAADLKIEISGIKSIAQSGGGLCWPLVSEHTLIPRYASETVGFLPSLGRALRRMPDRTAVDALARLGAHPTRMRQRGVDRQAATGWARNRTQPLQIVGVDKSRSNRVVVSVRSEPPPPRCASLVPAPNVVRFIGPFLARFAISREWAAELFGSLADADFRAMERGGDFQDRRAMSSECL
jgi:hypothetical protein